MASGTLVASTTQVNAGGQVTLTVAISDFDNNAITLSADNDPGDNSGWQNVTLDANQGASVTVTLANAGSYTFTLNIDGTPALDGAGNAVTAGPITAAAPPTTTTTAPATTTTAPSTTTTAPATTTTAPSTTTTVPASTTTAPSTTTTAPASTTTAPSTTTTVPASTTTAPATTTTVPASTTTAPSTTTTAPASTTTAPSTTTTAPASTTTAPSTTTTEPASTTTAPSTTTTAPSTTTTAGPPSLDDFSGKPKEDDGLQHDPTSLQIELGKVVVLTWQISSAPDGVELTDPAQSGPQKFDANTLTTEVTPQDDAQDYSMVAVAGDQRSESKTVHVSTHPVGHVYSPHAQVLGPGQQPVINYFRILAQGGDVGAASDSLTAAPGATVTLAWELEGDAAKVEIDNDVGDVTDKTTASGDASGDGTADVTLPSSGDSVTYTLTLTPEDSQFQPVTQQVTATLEAQPSTTTTAPSTTTTAAPSTTTTAAPSTTTTAPSTTTTAPSTTTTKAFEAPKVTLTAPEAVDKAGGDAKFSWTASGDFSDLALAFLDQSISLKADTKSGKGSKTIKLPDLSDKTTVTFTLTATAMGGQQDAVATSDAQVGPAPSEINVDDLDLSFVDPESGEEEIKDIEWSHLKFQKDVDLGPYPLVKSSWFGKGLDLDYAKVSGQFEAKFSGKVFTWPGKEGKFKDEELHDKLIKRFDSRLADFAATKPEGKYEPFDVEAKPQFSKPSGKVVDSNWPSIDVGFSFAMKFGEDLEFEAELAVIKFEKESDGKLKGGVGEVEIHGAKAVAHVELAFKDTDSKEIIAAVKGNIFIGVGVTISPKWDKIAVQLGTELVGEEAIEALGFDIGIGDIALVVLANPEILLIAIPFIVFYEILSAIQDGEDLKKVADTLADIRSKYPQGVIDGMMTVGKRFNDSKPYDSGYKVGVECHKRLHTAYKGKFLKLKKNKAWAKGKTDADIDQAVDKLLAERLCDSPVPYTISGDIVKRLEPGWRHDLYCAFRDAHKGSPWLVRDVAFILTYGDLVPHDDYRIGYDMKTVPSDVFFNSADADAWYHHPPHYGQKVPQTPAQRREKAPDAPKPGDKIKSPDYKPPPPPPPDPHPGPPPSPSGGKGGGKGQPKPTVYDTLDDAMKALGWNEVNAYQLEKNDVPLCRAYAPVPPPKKICIVPVDDGKFHVIQAVAPFSLMLLIGPPHHIGDDN